MKTIQNEINHLAMLEMLEQEQTVQGKIEAMKKAYGSEILEQEIKSSGFSIILKRYL